MDYKGSKPFHTLVLYEIYVRNHSEVGTFQAVENDLDRIKTMGVDLIWLMPIHPIGKENKKGTLGCPYSISDYRAINPEFGTINDFQHLIHEIHARGMLVMMDVVFNHTSHDSILINKHPEYFHLDKHRKPTINESDWSDVIHLKHPNSGLTRYLTDTLARWVKMGVDGFRCDVASLVPLSVWHEIKNEIAQINPRVIWLAESVHPSFIETRRSKGLTALSDAELYQEFDLTYDYDIWPLFQAVVIGKEPVDRLVEMYRFQHAILPNLFCKIHFVENHDQARIMSLASSTNQALAWTAFQAFNQGAFLIYGGQESGATHTPSLFDHDPIDWYDYPFQDFLTRLAMIKKNVYIQRGQFIISAGSPAIIASYFTETGGLLGVFNVSANSGEISVPIRDGSYTDIISQATVSVGHGKTFLPQIAMIIRNTKRIQTTGVVFQLNGC